MMTDEEKDPWRDRDGNGTILDTYKKHAKTLHKQTEQTTCKSEQAHDIQTWNQAESF